MPRAGAPADRHCAPWPRGRLFAHHQLNYRWHSALWYLCMALRTAEQPAWWCTARIRWSGPAGSACNTERRLLKKSAGRGGGISVVLFSDLLSRWSLLIQKLLRAFALLECLTKYSAHPAEVRTAQTRGAVEHCKCQRTKYLHDGGKYGAGILVHVLALAVGAVCWTASRWLTSKRSGEQQLQSKLGRDLGA